jgi:hydrogenase/urease accessory protein HupE
MSMHWVRGTVLWLLLTVAAAGAHAHELSMAELELRETSPGQFLWGWTASGKYPAGDELALEWPTGCAVEGPALHCDAAGLSGSITVRGVGKSYSAALVKVYWFDGQSHVYTLTSTQPTAHLFGAALDRRGVREIASAYTVLGTRHILGGIDHLLFVVSLLFLVGFNRRLLATITAFTLAHSITLALSALGWLTLRPPPVEATIALSIMLVAGEALHGRETLSRRWPAMVAFLFGLVHGLGFAGALKEIGLPQGNLLVALLTFNLGVEIGQLAVVALCYVAWRALARPSSDGQYMPARTVALYSIGGVAAYWSLERIVLIFG